MKIRIQNLGKIKDTELEVRPLTVIIGPNNSNKTYIAYSLYGLWQSLRVARNSELQAKIRELPQNNYLLPLHNLTASMQSVCDIVSNSFPYELEEFYQDTSGRLFTDTEFEIKLSEDDIRPVSKAIDGQIIGGNVRQIKIEATDKALKFAYVQPNDMSDTDYKRLIRRPNLSYALPGYFSRLVSNTLFPKPYLLPAERNAFIITYKVLQNQRMRLLLNQQRMLIGSHTSGNRSKMAREFELLGEMGEIRYPQPIEDFLALLSDIEVENSRSLRKAKHEMDEEDEEDEETVKPPERHHNPNFVKLADLIEKNLQGSNKTTFRNTSLGGKKIMINVGGGLNIDLYNASSSIKQLAPFLLYLRHRAEKGDMLIIDEPEMNLHPESQVKLLEILAMLVNQGVNVLLTTHSPYVMAHLNNIVQSNGNTDGVKKRQASSLFLKNPNAFLKQAQVSAYEMKDNKLQTLDDLDYGLRWDTLSNVSVDVQQKYFEMEEKGRQKTSAKRS